MRFNPFKLLFQPRLDDLLDRIDELLTFKRPICPSQLDDLRFRHVGRLVLHRRAPPQRLQDLVRVFAEADDVIPLVKVLGVDCLGLMSTESLDNH